MQSRRDLPACVQQSPRPGTRDSAGNETNPWLPSELTIWSGGQPGGVTTGWGTSSAGNARAAVMDRTLERAFQNDLSGEVTSEQGHKGRASRAEGRHLPRLCGRREGRSPEEGPSPPRGCPTGPSDWTQPPPGSRLPQPAAPTTSPMSGAGGGSPCSPVFPQHPTSTRQPAFGLHLPARTCIVAGLLRRRPPAFAPAHPSHSYPGEHGCLTPVGRKPLVVPSLPVAVQGCGSEEGLSGLRGGMARPTEPL